MPSRYSSLAQVTVPFVGAHDTLGLGRSLLKRADDKVLPKRLHSVVTALRDAFAALETKLARRERRAGATGSLKRDDIDVQADRLLSVIHGVLTEFARLPEGVAKNQGDAARALLPVLFREGLAAIVQAKFRAQHERMHTLLALANESGRPKLIAKVALADTFAALSTLMPAYAELADAALSSNPDELEYVREEMLALRGAIANYALRVAGDAADGDRNKQLRAARLLKPLRVTGEKESQKRAEAKGARGKANPEEENAAQKGEGSKGATDAGTGAADEKKPAQGAGTAGEKKQK